MGSNLPILYRNIMDGLPSEDAKKAFLWATDKTGNDRGLYRAEAFAREVGELSNTLWEMIGMAGTAHDGFDLSCKIDMHIFMMRRHAHYSFPGNNDAWT